MSFLEISEILFPEGDERSESREGCVLVCV